MNKVLSYYCHEWNLVGILSDSFNCYCCVASSDCMAGWCEKWIGRHKHWLFKIA